MGKQRNYGNWPHGYAGPQARGVFLDTAVDFLGD